MNYMEQVAKMLGVELCENFMIQSEVGLFYLHKDGLHTIPENYRRNTPTLYSVLVGDQGIVKLPWKPKVGEEYWNVGKDCSVAHYTKQGSSTRYFDMCFRVGNCYRSREEITPEIIQGWVDWYDDGPCPVKEE